jgi:ferredoxin, 2Fe-2S
MATEDSGAMGQLTVTYTDVKGTTHELADVEDGVSLMEVAKLNGVEGIYGDCGGGCACATCHVYVAGEWMDRVGQPDEIEFAMLDMVADVMQDNSRLGCQIKMRSELDGISVTVAPASGF